MLLSINTTEQFLFSFKLNQPSSCSMVHVHFYDQTDEGIELLKMYKSNILSVCTQLVTGRLLCIVNYTSF